MRTDVARGEESALRAEHDERFVEQRHGARLVPHVRGERDRMPVAGEDLPVVRIERAVARQGQRALEMERGEIGGCHACLRNPTRR
jgi:hypothetical protein